jgi:Effector-associated domain 10
MILAAAPTISLPIVRILQDRLLPRSQQVHVAEVFLGGLLKPLVAVDAQSNPDLVPYEFMDGARDVLLDSVPTTEVVNVMQEVSQFVAERLGLTLDAFMGVLRNPQETGDLDVVTQSRPFALMTAQILRKLGGGYAQLAQELEQANRQAPRQLAFRKLSGMSENLQKIIDQLKTGNYTPEDVREILSEIYAGRLVLASGSESVGIGGDASDTSIVTGDRNIIIYGADAQIIQSVLDKNGLYQDPETIKRIVREELRLPQREYGNSVSQGLNALADLMQYPEAMSAVITFLGDFQTTCEQINIIVNYVEVLDLLYTLEFQCYNGILQESKRFPADETGLGILSDHELTLQEILKEAQEVTARETTATKEVIWLEDLKRAQVELQGAIEELDTRRLQRTIWLLNRVFAIQPSRINNNLNSAARTLRIPNLVNALKYIRDKLAMSNLDRDKIRQFQEGVEVLAELNERLIALVNGHDYWQELDLELRRIESNLEQDSIELEMSWPDLNARTNVLFTGEPGELWAVAFEQDRQNLDLALNAQNPVKIKRYFRMYRRRASDRFYQVIVSLKRLCEELREVGEPLASILRITE